MKSSASTPGDAARCRRLSLSHNEIGLGHGWDPRVQICGEQIGKAHDKTPIWCMEQFKNEACDTYMDTADRAHSSQFKTTRTVSTCALAVTGPKAVIARTASRIGTMMDTHCSRACKLQRRQHPHFLREMRHSLPKSREPQSDWESDQ